MENITLFVVSVVIYFFVSELPHPFSDVSYEKSKGLKKVGIIALLCLPVNIDGNVFTVAGNAIAEKNIYSGFSFFQEAKNGKAVGVLGVGNVQIAKKKAVTFLGFSSYQKANKAAVVFGGAISQESKEVSVVILGIAFYQRSEKTAGIGIGIAGYQDADEKAEALAAMALYQKVQNKDRAFAFASSLTAPAPVPEKAIEKN